MTVHPATSPTSAIVVTGAAGGIGRALTELLTTAPDFHPDTAVLAVDSAWTAADLAVPSKAERHRLDVTVAEAVAEFFTQLAAAHRLRALANVAGVLVTGEAVDLSRADIDRLVSVNLTGVIEMSTAAARTMLAQQPAPDGDATGTSTGADTDRSILTIASNAGSVPRAGFAAYGATKAAAAHFTRSLGLELGHAGIRCNVVNPGTTRTDMVARMWDGHDRSAEAIAGDPSRFRTGIPLGRIAEPDDIARVAAFLLSDAACHVTAAELTVDGGATTP
ncbi:SDR family oxidoreductase [Brevibacterium otitidis]|uniref:SDR family oxidoreductase n=1 Tax=Brevibacterium otitidis TaxID=53364 RepID=A0ABV5X5K9_9MICO|nr:2,3-dihydro-2,3-dihydroxybenzoate dehydrogenase [Brevibacterium otitidis]